MGARMPGYQQLCPDSHQLLLQTQPPARFSFVPVPTSGRPALSPAPISILWERGDPSALPGVSLQPRALLSPFFLEQRGTLRASQARGGSEPPPPPSTPLQPHRAQPPTFGQPQVYTPVDLKALKLLLHPSLAAAVVEGALLQHLQGRLAFLVGQHGVPVAAGQALPQRAVPGAAAGLRRAQLVGSHAVHGHPPAMGVLPRRGRGAGQRAEDLIWARGRGRRDEGTER